MHRPLAAFLLLLSCACGQRPVGLRALDAYPSPLVLAHRGHVEGTPENTLEGVRAVAAAGYFGVEVDVVVEGSNRLVVRHELAGGADLLLEDLLRDTADAGMFYWLDLKNMDPGNQYAVAAEVQRLVSLLDLRGRVLVETRFPPALRALWIRAPDVLTAWWMNVDPEMPDSVQDDVVRGVVGGTRPDVLSVPLDQLDAPKTEQFQDRLPMAIWPITNQDDMEHALTRNAVIVLTDVDLRAQHPGLYRQDVRAAASRP